MGSSRFDESKDSLFLLLEVSGRQVHIQCIKEAGVMSFEIEQEFLDRSDKQAYATKVAHVRLDMNGINPLICKTYLEHLGKLLCNRVKENLVQAHFRELVPHGPQTLETDIGIRVRVLGD